MLLLKDEVQVFAPHGEIIFKGKKLLEIVRQLEEEMVKEHKLAPKSIPSLSSSSSSSTSNNKSTSRSGRQALIEDAKQCIQKYSQSSSNLKGLEFENDMLLFRFDIGKKGVKVVNFSLSYEGYPKTCTIWSDEVPRSILNLVILVIFFLPKFLKGTKSD